MRKKKYYEIRKLFCFCFSLYKEKPQLKVEIEDGREAPQKPSYYIYAKGIKDMVVNCRMV